MQTFTPWEYCSSFRRAILQTSKEPTPKPSKSLCLSASIKTPRMWAMPRRSQIWAWLFMNFVSVNWFIGFLFTCLFDTIVGNFLLSPSLPPSFPCAYFLSLPPSPPLHLLPPIFFRSLSFSPPLVFLLSLSPSLPSPFPLPPLSSNRDPVQRSY